MSIMESIKGVYRADETLGLAVAQGWQLCNPALTEGWISKALGTAGIIGAGALAGHKINSDADQKVHHISELLKGRTELSQHLDDDKTSQRYQSLISELKRNGVTVYKNRDGGLTAMDLDGNTYDGTTGEILPTAK